jgi:phospholipid/cholesterol/gamma-HCH transport system ATP-binding protein
MADSSARVAMRVDDLVVAFGDRVVLDHLSIDVVRGEIVGLVGASGGGKSVLLRAILGLLPTRGGRIEILGVDRDQMNAEELQALERRWGVLYQQGALFSSLTVFQNIEFPMREYLKLSPRLMREVATAKLEMVGISPEEGDKYPAALSGGMTKRVALARALALDPEIVFLDEPTSGLDPIAAGDFDNLILTLQRTLGVTVFMITHDLQSLSAVCDRIAALAEGKIVAIGSMEEMLKAENPWVRSYFRGDRARFIVRSHDAANQG